MVAIIELANSQHQLDFWKISFCEMKLTAQSIYKVSERENLDDCYAIKKVKTILVFHAGGFMRFTVAEREGNCFDIYCNAILVEEIKGP
jgi:hypothetical protein